MVAADDLPEPDDGWIIPVDDLPPDWRAATQAGPLASWMFLAGLAAEGHVGAAGRIDVLVNNGGIALADTPTCACCRRRWLPPSAQADGRTDHKPLHGHYRARGRDAA